jgi:hypothetical protein
MDNAHRSRMIQSRLKKSGKLRGVLATVEEGELEIPRKDISVRIVDKQKAIQVLKSMRMTYLNGGEGPPQA